MALLGDMVRLKQTIPEVRVHPSDDTVERRIGFLAYYPLNGLEVMFTFHLPLGGLKRWRPVFPEQADVARFFATAEGRRRLIAWVERKAREPKPEVKDVYRPTAWERLLSDDFEPL
jgi:hypothetical protein